MKHADSAGSNFLPLYLKVIPKQPAEGSVIVHNNVRPTRRLGSRGFRAWYDSQKRVDSGALIRCDCKWAPELGVHFRVTTRVKQL